MDQMKLVDRVLDKSSNKIIALKNVTINEPCFRDHIIDNEPVLPGSIILEVIGQNYVRTARAKGMTERMVISKHIVKNAMTPVMTTLGLTMSGLIKLTV